MPRWVRCKLAYQPSLVTRVLQLFLRAIFTWQRRRARQLGARDGKPGAVTFVQRFGAALNLNIHFHALIPDGVFIKNGDGMDFIAIEPSDSDVYTIAVKVVGRILRLIESSTGEDAVHSLDQSQVDLYQEAAVPSRRLHLKHDGPIKKSRRTISIDGFSVHANVSIGAAKREALARLARYGGRPPLALARLSETGDGRLSYKLKHTAPGASPVVVLTPHELLRKLAALVPLPRVHMVRYHGCFAPNAKCRSKVVPPAVTSPDVMRANTMAGQRFSEAAAILVELTRPRRLKWAALLMRVFAVDVLACEKCGGSMRMLAILTDSKVTQHILKHLGLPHVPPLRKPVRDPTQANGVQALYQEELGPDYGSVDFAQSYFE